MVATCPSRSYRTVSLIAALLVDAVDVGRRARLPPGPPVGGRDPVPDPPALAGADHHVPVPQPRDREPPPLTIRVPVDVMGDDARLAARHVAVEDHLVVP